jgi:drug/metabolite transporter (DMT)-like permease
MDNKTALILILLSALIHPIWNMILKKSRDKTIFYFNIHLFYTVMFSFIIFIYPLKSVSAVGWTMVMLSGIAHFFYQVYLCRSYELGDMSLTYPIIRSAPIFVAIMGVIFLKEKLSPIAVLGITLTVFGAQIINQKQFSRAELLQFWKCGDKKTMLVAILTALFSAIYSVVDKKGVLEVEPVLYFYLFFTLSGLLFGAYLFLFKQRMSDYWQVTKKNKYKITLAAILEFSSYILILYAFRMTNVAVVVAIRQISVVFGALLGIIILQEKYARIRVLASLIIFTGVYLLAAFQ